jgi:PTS system galactitol-specific IIA component
MYLKAITNYTKETIKLSDSNPLKRLVKKDLVIIDSNAKNSTELFNTFSKIAIEKGYVNRKFLPKIIERESNFPTGLALDNYSVAIPHTDADTIEDEFVGVIVSKNGTKFKRMDDPGKEIDAKVEFILGLKQPHAQLEMLQYLMSLIQDEGKIQKLINSNSVNEVIKLLR